MNAYGEPQPTAAIDEGTPHEVEKMDDRADEDGGAIEPARPGEPVAAAEDEQEPVSGAMDQFVDAAAPKKKTKPWPAAYGRGLPLPGQLPRAYGAARLPFPRAGMSRRQSGDCLGL